MCTWRTRALRRGQPKQPPSQCKRSTHQLSVLTGTWRHTGGTHALQMSPALALPSCTSRMCSVPTVPSCPGHTTAHLCKHKKGIRSERNHIQALKPEGVVFHAAAPCQLFGMLLCSQMQLQHPFCSPASYSSCFSPCPPAQHPLSAHTFHSKAPLALGPAYPPAASSG